MKCAENAKVLLALPMGFYLHRLIQRIRPTKAFSNRVYIVATVKQGAGDPASCFALLNNYAVASRRPAFALRASAGTQETETG